MGKFTTNDNGEQTYACYATDDYPYVIGAYKGTPAAVMGERPAGPPPLPPGPPPNADLSGANTFTGDAANNTFSGGAGKDRLSGGGGAADKITAGAGNDTAVLKGNRAHYQVTQTGRNRFEVRDKAGNVDTFTNVETLKFADGKMKLK
jgi:Ca2+-binding RTX toxin-like protein